MKRTGDLKLIQELNRFIILDTIRKKGPISRSDIAKFNKLSPTTVTSAVSELIRDGLVQEGGTGESKGGRKPILVRFVPDRHFIIAVSITNSNITIAEMNLDAKVSRKETYPVGTLKGSQLVEHIITSLETFLLYYLDLIPCIGISIITPGIVDPANGVIRYNPKLDLKDVPLKDIVHEKFHLKTIVDNDSNALVLAEKNFGDYKDHKNLIYITVGEGLGAGIYVNGSIFRGFHGGAGEFGHISIDRNGISCDCGNRGCLENYVNWPAIYSRILSAIARGRKTIIFEMTHGDMNQVTIDTFITALQKGDGLATEIMYEIADYLSTGIINLINLFNPDIIIIGGDVFCHDHSYLKRVENHVKENGMSILTDGLKVKPSSLGENFELVGAAAILLNEVFQFSLAT
ncbi:ROK family protein [Pseudalkalibacillus sp. A8]|uniref:ROK family transcriptional regulator n=1 Tax=Pseudalkalibacillus sp. A8 TaxID=3382641 RepID=UPI0038B44D4A